MIALLFVTLFSTAYGNVVFDSQCPDVTPVENFKIAEYGNGKWYELARYPHDSEKGVTCAYNLYSLIEDRIESQSFLVLNSKQYIFNGSLSLAADAGNTGKLIYSFSSQGKNIDRASYILDTDYENYAIAYFCKYNEEKNEHQDFAWVLARSVNLSPEIEVKVENFIKESNFLHYDKLIWNDSSCSLSL